MTRIAPPFAALSFAILCGGLATSTAAAIGYGVQPPGQFHDGEAVARHGERWLALRVRPDGAELLTAHVAVKRVHDALLDGEGEATGEAVSAIGLEDVAMLLRGPGLKPGDVIVADTVEASGEGDPPNHRLRLGQREYRLDTRCIAAPANDSTGQSAYACTIELSDGTHRQSLTALSGYRSQASDDPRIQLGDDASPRLIFAGDLDRDGRLDLIFDTTDHYNLSRPTLFLSGAAGKGEVVRAVATHDAVGC
jgi:hypothetical protein